MNSTWPPVLALDDCFLRGQGGAGNECLGPIRFQIISLYVRFNNVFTLPCLCSAIKHAYRFNFHTNLHLNQLGKGHSGTNSHWWWNTQRTKMPLLAPWDIEPQTTRLEPSRHDL